MKKILIAALVLSVVAVAVEGFAAPTDAIKQVFVALDRCLADNDAKCVGELMADDATFAAPEFGSRVVKTKVQVVKKLEELMGVPAPNMKGAKRTHSVENVRMIGEDHAVVDASITVAGAPKPEGEAEDHGAYHAIAVMVLQGGTWRFEDLRSYVVQPDKKAEAPGKKTAAPEQKAEEEPAKN